jgi:hypothetical protein
MPLQNDDVNDGAVPRTSFGRVFVDHQLLAHAEAYGTAGRSTGIVVRRAAVGGQGLVHDDQQDDGADDAGRAPSLPFIRQVVAAGALGEQARWADDGGGGATALEIAAHLAAALGALVATASTSAPLLPPPPPAVSPSHGGRQHRSPSGGGGPRWSSGFCTKLGPRNSNEDRLVALPNLQDTLAAGPPPNASAAFRAKYQYPPHQQASHGPPGRQGFFAVYDGHCGDQASTHLQVRNIMKPPVRSVSGAAGRIDSPFPYTHTPHFSTDVTTLHRFCSPFLCVRVCVRVAGNTALRHLLPPGLSHRH